MGQTPTLKTQEMPSIRTQPEVHFCVRNPPQVFYDQERKTMDTKYPACFVDIPCGSYKTTSKDAKPSCLICIHHRVQ